MHGAQSQVATLRHESQGLMTGCLRSSQAVTSRQKWSRVVRSGHESRGLGLEPRDDAGAVPLQPLGARPHRLERPLEVHGCLGHRIGCEELLCLLCLLLRRKLFERARRDFLEREERGSRTPSARKRGKVGEGDVGKSCECRRLHCTEVLDSSLLYCTGECWTVNSIEQESLVERESQL